MSEIGLLWMKAHDALREYHRLRASRATTSVVGKAWAAYRRAKRAAQEAEIGRSGGSDV